MSKLPFMPLYVSDYDAATTYLSLEEDGLYGRVLRMMWATPNCSLPDDKNWLMKRLRITEEQYEYTFLFLKKEYFKVSRGRIYQKRLQSEHVKANGIVKARSDAGKRGGRPKSVKTNEKDKSKGSALPKQSESKSKASTLTSTITPIEDIPPISPPRGKRKTGLSDDFIPSRESAEKYWQSQGRSDLSYDLIADEFKTYCLANGKTYQDWDAAWKTWYVNAIKFSKPTGERKHSERPEDFGVDADSEITATITRVT